MSRTATVCATVLMLALIAAAVLGADTMRNCAAACGLSGLARFTESGPGQPSKCECVREVQP